MRFSRVPVCARAGLTPLVKQGSGYERERYLPNGTSPRPARDVLVTAPGQSADAEPPLRQCAASGSLPRWAGLDGLRAVTVAAVVLFDLDSQWLPGGFLGVDVFFVISGYLITRLLVTEIMATGRLRLGAFYLRRARRLLPAVLVLLVVMTLADSVIWRDQFPMLTGGLLASLGYVNNWWLIFDHQSYFVSAGRPPVLQHLWSLAIEEQYYLVWAGLLLVLTGAGLMRRGARASVSGVVVAALLLAAASTAAMAVLAIRDGVPYRADSARVYFGTDTHTMGLLLGSAAGAFAARPVRRRARIPLWVSDLLAGAGLVALVWCLARLGEFDPLLYRGWLPALAAVTLTVICAVVRSGSRVGRWLDVAPMRWVGQRSYSIYLWHWPVVVVTRPGLDVHGPSWLIALARVGLTGVLAAASYRFVEVPLRYQARRAPRPPPRPRPRWPLPVGATAGIACISVLVTAGAATRPGPARAVAAQATLPMRAHAALSPRAATLPQSRDPVDGPSAAAPKVIHTGTNGIIDPAQLTRTLTLLRDRRQVILLTDKVPRDWEAANNRTLRAAARRFGNVTLVDWHSISTAHHGWFWNDGIHLNPTGAAGYAQLILGAMRD
jgi:peptidoglycan/LPS O-acetylase OafA/YrhL